MASKMMAKNYFSQSRGRKFRNELLTHIYMISKITKPTIKEIRELKLETLTKMSDLATAGFGLVAALAWNEAIQSLVNSILPKNSSGGITAQIIYAVIITALVVFVTMRLGKMTNAAKEQLAEAKGEKK